MKLLFLGVGNRHRADDGVGPYVAERLTASGALFKRGVEILPHGGEGATLMFLWEGADKVVVVDAMKSKRKAGFVQRFEPHKEKLETGVFRYSSHLFGLAEAVEMARALGKLPKEMVVFGIEGKVFDFDKPMSRIVEKTARDVAAAVLKEFGVEE